MQKFKLTLSVEKPLSTTVEWVSPRDLLPPPLMVVGVVGPGPTFPLPFLVPPVAEETLVWPSWVASLLPFALPTSPSVNGLSAGVRETLVGVVVSEWEC